MRPHSEKLPEVLAGGSFNRRLRVDVFHGTDRQFQGLDLTKWQLDWDLTGDNKMVGSGTVAFPSVAGESLVPDGANGVLSPFKATLLLVMEIFTNDGFSETVTLGWAKVTAIGDAFDVYANIAGVQVVTASQVDITFQGLEVNLKRWGFRSPEQIPDLTSCYAELRRITSMPVTETVDDKPIPSAIVYEASQGGRLKGVQDLAGVLGGVAVVNPAGALTVVPITPGEPVGELLIGANGTVTDVGFSIDTENVYNVVVGNFEDENRNPIYSVAQQTTGPLAVDTYGEYTEYYSSDLVKTQQAADEAVQTRLATSIAGQTYEVPVQCIITPLVEIGDVMAVKGGPKPLQGMTTKVSMSDSVLMNVTLSVQRSF